MDPVLIGALSAALVFVLILIGLHVGVALALTSVLGIYLISGKWSVAFRLLESTSYNALNDYVFAVIPLFILMGAFATVSGVMRELFESMGAALKGIRGGLGIATVAGNAVFSAITGVTVASAVVFSQVSIPEMKRLGYDKKFALGIVASSALLGMLIPPSILMVVYGVITEESIGKLFAAGMGPGLIVSLALSLAIVVMIRLRPELCGVEGTVAARSGPILSRRQLITRPWAVYALVLLVLGGIYAGWFTPTEAGGVGALGAFILMVLKRKFGFKTTYDLLLQYACPELAEPLPIRVEFNGQTLEQELQTDRVTKDAQTFRILRLGSLTLTGDQRGETLRLSAGDPASPQLILKSLLITKPRPANP